jgi:hypothetical protein
MRIFGLIYFGRRADSDLSLNRFSVSQGLKLREIPSLLGPWLHQGNKNPMHPLNTDLIELILRELSPDRVPVNSPDFSWFNDLERGDDSRLLAPLCLVSRMWLESSRHRLYRSISISVTNTPVLFERFITTVENAPSIRHLVRYLTISVTGDNHQKITSLIKLLPRCFIFAQSAGNQWDDAAINSIVQWEPLYALATHDIFWTTSIWTTASQRWKNLTEPAYSIRPWCWTGNLVFC